MVRSVDNAGEDLRSSLYEHHVYAPTYPDLQGSAEESRLNKSPVLRKPTNDFTSVGCQSPGDDDRDLIASIARGHCEAFHELYVKYHRRLARFIVRISWRKEDVEEIINDTFMIVWQSAGEYRHASQVSTWIFGIAYRTALRSLRRQRRHTSNVRLEEADRNAEAQQAVFARAAQTTVLTGQAMVRDAGSETHAPKLTFFQSTGDIEAEGPVRSTDFGSKSTSLQMRSVPANLSADHMRANSKTGRAVYTGHARLWQGASVLEAETIELLRPSRTLNATGNVRAVFPQAPQPGATPGSAPVWHVSSGLLTYWDTENRAHLEKDVFVQSADQKMRAPQLELFFTRTGADKQGSGGTSQISRAVGTGGVVVEQGDRRGTAERGLYTAAEEKYVLTGGTPTLFDPVEGTTTGRELTFYRADDTIVVDSGNGLRTLTKHRVQR